MTATPTFADHVVVVSSLAFSTIFWLWLYPRLSAAILSGARGARMRLYRLILGCTWALSVAVVAIWLWYSRAWGAIGVRLEPSWGLAAGLLLAAGYVALAEQQRRRIIARPEVMRRLAAAYKDLEPLLPATRADRRVFAVVSVSAGICEEFFYRGFLVWYFTAYAGTAAAVLFSAAVFGFDHIYQQRRALLKITLLGVAFSLITLLSGSLLPAMIIHATIDLTNGDLGARVFGAHEGDAEPPAAGLTYAATR